MTRKGNELHYEMVIDSPRDFAATVRTDISLMPKFYKSALIWAKEVTGSVEEGGTMNVLMVDGGGNEYRSKSRFTEVIPGKRLKYVFDPEIVPVKGILMDESLDDFEGKTRYTTTVTFGSQEDMMKMMELGWHMMFSEFMAHFGELVTEMLKKEKVPK